MLRSIVHYLIPATIALGVATAGAAPGQGAHDSGLSLLAAGAAPQGAEPQIDPAARDGGADASWWEAVSANLAQTEYQASLTADGLQAPNRAQNFRIRFRDEGPEIEPRTDERAAPAWRVTWTTARIGRLSRMHELGPVAPQVNGSRVTYARPGLGEWYENSAAGFEQWFTLEERPEGDGPLRIEGRFGGDLRPELRSGAVDLMTADGACALRYGKLQVWDANRVELRSEIMVDGQDVVLRIEDGGATYPITVDPVMTTPAWITEGNQVEAGYGCWVATAGDVNGDGLSDVIVGAVYYDNGQPNEGEAFVYLGSAAGLATTPAWTAESNQAQAFFGGSVGTAGDVNGDGYVDVIVGATGYSNGQVSEGRAYVYLGSAAGLATTPAWTAESNQSDAEFGQSVATAGDVNGDGYSDVIVGALYYDNGQSNEGRAYVYMGSATGLATNPAWTAESDQVNADFGGRVGTAGDVNGDAYADVIVAAMFYDNGQPNEGRAFVYLGSAAGLATTAWTAEGDQDGADFGWSVGTAGDVNGDGFSDVIVGASTYDNGQPNEGGAFVYLGSAAGLATNPAWTAESDQVGATFGSSVGTAGDVNGDGYADVIVGAENYSNGQIGEGCAYVYLGSAGGLGATPVWTAEGDQANLFGLSVATAGDVNGDGYSDVIAGAYTYDNGQTDEGRAYVYHGAAAGLISSSAWTAQGTTYLELFGLSVASAGDVNGDGYSDLIISSPQYTNDQEYEGRVFVYYSSATGVATTPSWTVDGNQAFDDFGRSVASAGDVNGDGYSDVIIGSASYSNGQQFEGRALVYHGSATGLAASPAWIAEPNQALARFGQSVATAGDVNGDGFSDVIVGADTYSNGQTDEGAAFVYLGSPTGLQPFPTWTAEGNQADGEFGSRVATAGDVNGDGYSDVIVGAYFYDNGQPDEGRAFVYLGSATGLQASSAWTAEGNQGGAHFGQSVATAGDVNGDGYSDVIVGAPYYDNGEPDEGRVFAYYGSSAGLPASPAWTAERDEVLGYFGRSVASAGDVNGDGYSDAIVGSDGTVSAYHGSSAGLSVAPDWAVVTDQPGSQFGYSVAAAGDPNGDGYSDVIVGAFGYDQIFMGEEGKAFLYLGNDGTFDGNSPRAQTGNNAPIAQVRTDDTAPISLLGTSDSPYAFRLKVFARSPGGRGRVRLIYEVKPADVPFDGRELVAGPLVDTGDPGQGGGSVLLSELASGLAPETLYKWRARVLTNSPFFPGTKWLWHPGNAVTEPDLHTAGGTTAVAGADESSPRVMALEPAAPNPFNTGVGTTIAYTLPRDGQVRLAVYDVKGRKVTELENRAQSAGQYLRRWMGLGEDGRPVAAGVYFLHIELDGASAAQKLIVAP